MPAQMVMQVLWVNSAQQDRKDHRASLVQLAFELTAQQVQLAQQDQPVPMVPMVQQVKLVTLVQNQATKAPQVDREKRVKLANLALTDRLETRG